MKHKYETFEKFKEFQSEVENNRNKKINDNTYKLKLPVNFGISLIFNIAYLKPYLGEKDELPSRTTSFQGGDDEDINTIVTPTTPAAIHTGPITRSRARQLNYHVLPFLGKDSIFMRI